MLALLLKQAGIDVDNLTTQAEGISQTFRHIGLRLEGIEDRLGRIEQNQVALLLYHGLYAEPSPEVAKLIEEKSAELTGLDAGVPAS